MLSGDFGWSQWRNANAGVYVIIDVTTGKVMHQIVLTKACTQRVGGKEILISKGNYFGTSKGMEGFAFCKMLDWLEEKQLLLYLQVFVCDQDSLELHKLKTNPCVSHVDIVHNPGHTKKNFIKDLCHVLGTCKAYQGYAERISRWFMWAVKESQKVVCKQGIMDCEQQQEVLVAEFTC